MQEFNQKMQEQLKVLAATGKLFRSEITGNTLWEIYLDSFENDPIFRDPASSEHKCNLCCNFIRRYGNIVAIDTNNQIITLFDFTIEGEFKNTPNALSSKLKSAKIENVFFETFNELNSLNYEKCSKNNAVFRLGIDKNHKRYTKEEAEKFGVVKPNEIRTFNHMFLDIPTAFVDMTGKSVESIISGYKDAKNVFKRAMEEISLDTLHLVRDLISQGSLLDGQTHLYKIEQIIPLKKEFDSIPAAQRDAWCWVNSYKLPFAKFKNELIGVLCSELAEGEDLNKACQNWNKRVDPANYMKAVAPITKKQIEEAKKFVEENGFEESFNRRFATLADIQMSEILHASAEKAEIKGVSIFDGVKPVVSRHKRNEFDDVEEVSIEKFMSDILPNCTSVEVFLTNQQEGNLVSMTTANTVSKPIFKWDNNYSWTYNGNLAGKSQIKEEVRSKGGKVDGVLRFSMMWADGNGDNSDLDLHCIEPNKTEIYYLDKVSHRTRGNLDIDITRPGGKLAVENITYPSLSKMDDGVYRLFIRQFSARSSKGFKAEIEFDGELYSYSYDKPVSGDIQIAEVKLKDGKFSIVHKLQPVDGIGKELYGLETNQFHKVNLMCLSPNHWGENNVGNRHYFFMLEGAKCPVSIRSFHNENLIPELAQHRKVLEVLGNTTMIAPAEKQLSGLGFNATVKDEVILKLSGSHKRVVKVKFSGVDFEAPKKAKVKNLVY